MIISVAVLVEDARIAAALLVLPPTLDRGLQSFLASRSGPGEHDEVHCRYRMAASGLEALSVGAKKPSKSLAVLASASHCVRHVERWSYTKDSKKRFVAERFDWEANPGKDLGLGPDLQAVYRVSTLSFDAALVAARARDEARRRTLIAAWQKYASPLARYRLYDYCP